MMRRSFRISITVFLWLTSSLLMGVFLAVCLGSLSSMQIVGKKASEVRQVSLPEVTETQRSFINIESLRRLAEVVYISENAQIRRAARVRAQALAAESVFIRNHDFYQQAQALSARINELASLRDEVYTNRARLKKQGKEFLTFTYRLTIHITDTRVVERINDASLAVAFSRIGNVSASREASKRIEDLLGLDDAQFSYILGACRDWAAQHPSLVPLCQRQERVFSEYTQTARMLSENLSLAYEKWESVDGALREMRDVVRTDAEFEIMDVLSSIEETSEQAITVTRYLVIGGVLFFILYLSLLHWFLVRPVRWVGRKLGDIQQGVVHTPAPDIRIAELYRVGDLLERFGVHIAELTSQASQLAGDAAEKRDLEALMTAVFQVSVDGYCVWKPGRLLTMNSELLRILGFTSTAELDASWDEIGFISRSEQLGVYERVVANGFWRREAYLCSAKGEQIPFEISYLPVKRQDGVWILSYFRDLRQQKITEEALRTAKDHAEEAARVKSEFLARMSHEIRTPMNGVLGLTHLALKDAPPPSQRTYLEKIQASARILLGVINDILDFSKMESGRFVLERRRFPFFQMLTTVVDLFSAQAREKGLDFLLESDPRLPEYVTGDELRLSQVLLNLCGNAMKFTEKGSVTLRAVLEDESEGFLMVRFSVTDTGLGMTEQQLASLFRPFAQADTSTTRKYGGTGLGLVISKLLVEMMQGGITVDSEPGKGSSFSFNVMLERSQGPDAAQTSPASPAQDSPAELKGLCILLAEDNEINQEIAVTLLRGLGCETIVASNGAEALDVLGRQDVDGILMDIQMPVMDGLTAARRIRESASMSIRMLPIIAMTAHAMQEDREKSLAAGMDDHITKPIDVDELRAVLLRRIARQGR